MTEKEMLLHVWEKEFPVTMKVLKAFPADQVDFKPHDRSRTAKALAWTIVTEEMMIGQATDGKVDYPGLPKAPATFAEVLSTYETSHADMVAKVKKTSDKDLNSIMIDFMVGPKQPGKIKFSDFAWMLIMDSIHHRGQFSVYLRMAGGKVPSIYGPSADEPWF